MTPAAPTAGDAPQTPSSPASPASSAPTLPDPPPPSRLRTKLGWLALAATLLAADLWSKHLVFYPHVLSPAFREGMVVGEVASWWRTILVYNQGVTFGMLSGVPAWSKALLTAGVIVWLAHTLWKLPAGRRVQATSLSMIVGGAVGNLYDRTIRPLVEPDRNPGVRDFLDWYAPDHWRLAGWLREHGVHPHWYTSNVADVLIVCGVLLLAGCLLREPGAKQPVPPAGAGSPPEAGA